MRHSLLSRRPCRRSALLLVLVRLGVQAQERLSPQGLRRLFRGIGLLLLASGLYGLLRAQGWVP